MIAGLRLRHNNEILKIEIPKNLNSDLLVGDIVIVKNGERTESGKIIYIKDGKADEFSEKIIRRANSEDKAKIERISKEEERTNRICENKIKKHGLKMRLVATSISFDERNLTFFYVAEGRVDFRELLRDLVNTFKKMIRLQQIGPKDAAKFIGGFGLCGRPVCCSTFLCDLKSITMDLARDQNMEGVTSSKISGLCGKLMCCLEYELKTYERLKKGLPKVGEEIKTEKGIGKVIGLNVLQRKVLVLLEDRSKLEVDYLEK